MSGFSDIGSMLGGLGGDPTMDPKYLTGMYRGAAASSMLEKARESRNQQLKIESITPDVITAYQNDPRGPGSSDIASRLLQAGINPENIAGFINKNQDTAFRDQAMATATAPTPDLNRLNGMLAAISGKPMTLSTVEGGVSLNPNQTPYGQAFAPTGVGTSDIARNMAAAGASNASVGDRNASTAEHNARTVLINTQNAAGGWAPSKANDKLPNVSEISAILPNAGEDSFGAKKVDPKDVQAVYGWLAQHKGASIGDYVAHGPVGSPGVINPAGNISVPSAAAGDGAGMSAAIAPNGAQKETASVPGTVSKSGDYTPPKTAGNGPPTPSSKAEFDALPKGAQFINPADGQLMVKK